jgi:hypothetical protein
MFGAGGSHDERRSDEHGRASVLNRIGVRRGVLAVLGAAVAGACRHASPPAPSPAAVPVVESGRVGDTAFAIRLVKLDQARGVARVDLPGPAHLVAIDVSPGGSLEVLSTTGAPLRQGGGAIGIASRAQRSAQATVTADCVARTIRPPTTRRVRRNVQRENGRPVDGGPDYVDVESGGVSRAEAEQRCRGVAGALPFARSRGFLVLFASPVPLPADYVSDRLTRLRVQADDVRGSIEAIGEGLFAGRDEHWSGYYVHW